MNLLHLITKTTSGYKATVHYHTSHGMGYFFGFMSSPDFDVPMIWFDDGTVFHDEYGDQDLDLTEYKNKENEESQSLPTNPAE